MLFKKKKGMKKNENNFLCFGSLNQIQKNSLFRFVSGMLQELKKLFMYITY